MKGAAAVTVAIVVLAARPARPRSRRAATGTPTGARWGRHTTVGVDERLARWLPVLLLAAFGVIVAGPLVGLVVGALAAASGPARARWRDHQRRCAVAAAVPDLVDLFVVSASAGLPVAASLAVVAPRAPSVTAPFVAGAARRFQRGVPLQDCLADLAAELGTAGQPLTDALAQAAASGVPLVPLLDAVAATTRDQRRRRAQEVARRLPVTMLFPLVACTLPAAVLLAVVPVLLVSLAALSP